MQTVRLMTKPSMARQGDVLIVPVSKAVDPADLGVLLEEPEKSRVVLAHGEATGHAHAFYPSLDIPVNIVRVENSSPEPTGEYKSYFLQGRHDARTAHAAVASTFGMTAEQYRPAIET